MLVLWSENLKIDSLEILKDPKIKRIAMANPKLTPYGKASMEVLDHLKLTPSLKSKIVYGASISQAHQFVATKNAQIGFGALSLIDKKDKNLSYFIIDKALYSPIKSALISLPTSLKEASYSLGKGEYYTFFLSYSLTLNPVY